MWLDRNNPKEFVVATVRACRVATIPCRNITPDLWGRGYGAEIGAAPSLGVRERPRFYRPSRLANYEHLTGMRLAQAAASCTGRGLKITSPILWRSQMVISLWLILASPNANITHVGDFSSMKDCTQAASDAKPIGVPVIRYSFVCVQSK